MRYGRSAVLRELASLGLDVDEDVRGWAPTMCPLHEDTSPSFAVHLEDGAWVCRAGCGSNGDLAVLVEAVTGEDVALSRDRMRRGEGLGTVDSVRVSLDRLFDREGPGEAPGEPLFYEQGRTPKFMFDRGFTAETLRRWGVGYDAERSAAVLPVWFDRKLRGLIYRRAVGEPKYQNTPFTKSDVLFGWDLLPEGRLEVTVVEGPLDAMWLDQHGYPSVAIMGTNLSRAQATLLLGRCWSVWLGFDADGPGRAATLKAAAALRSLTVRVVEYPPGRNDAQNCSSEELVGLFSSRSSAALLGVYAGVSRAAGVR